MIAKNNIFNIRKSEHYKWLGAEGQTKGFVDFKDTDYAIRACAYMLLRSYRIAGCHTIRKIISRYAPASENDTENYIKFVCKETGFQETEQLKTKMHYAKLIAAIAKMETSTKITPEKVLGIIQLFDLRLYSGRPYAVKE